MVHGKNNLVMIPAKQDCMRTPFIFSLHYPTSDREQSKRCDGMVTCLKVTLLRRNILYNTVGALCQGREQIFKFFPYSTVEGRPA